MRIAIISDIHGNDIAFEAVMNDLHAQAALRPIDRLVCNGDAIQGGPQPAQVAARLRQLAAADYQCEVVMGNADAYVLTGVDEEDVTTPPERLKMLQAVREWTLQQLGPADLDLINAFKPTVEIEMGGEADAEQKLLCFHGSPASFNHIILPSTADETVMGYLGAHDAAILTGGHTHLQQIRPVNRSIFFNPGSVGLAFSHQNHKRLFPWAEYAILTVEGGTRSLDFRRVPFDVAALLRVYEASGRPYAEDMIAQYQAR